MCDKLLGAFALHVALGPVCPHIVKPFLPSYLGTMIDITYQSLKLVLCSGTHALF